MSVVIPEEKEQGTISTKTYYRYFRAGGGILFIIAVLSSLCAGEVKLCANKLMTSLI